MYQTRHEKLKSCLLYTSRPYGSEKFGTRTEIKNLNSISNVQKAIEFEVARQEKVLISGGEVLQETRRYDEDSKETVVMRAKGDAVDYKYYPEPNILPIRLNHQWVCLLYTSNISYCSLLIVC